MANVAGKVEVGGHFHIFIRKEFLSLRWVVEGLQFSLCHDLQRPIFIQQRGAKKFREYYEAEQVKRDQEHISRDASRKGNGPRYQGFKEMASY